MVQVRLKSGPHMFTPSIALGDHLGVNSHTKMRFFKWYPETQKWEIRPLKRGQDFSSSNHHFVGGICEFSGVSRCSANFRSENLQEQKSCWFCWKPSRWPKVLEANSCWSLGGSCWMMREYCVSRLYFCVLRTCEKVMLQFSPFSTTVVAMVPSILPKNVWELVGPRKGRKESRVTQGYTSKGINSQWELLRIPKIIKLPSYISKLDCLLLILSWFPQPKCCFPGTCGKPVSILDQADAKVLSRAYCGFPSPICRCLSFNALRFASSIIPLGIPGVKILLRKNETTTNQP